VSRRQDLDVRPFPNPVRKNYDYGEGLYFGKMDKFKSVRDYLNKRKRKKINKKSLHELVEQIEIFSQEVLNLQK
jgi:hypothetical protein